MSDQTWLTTSAGLKMPPLIYGTAWKKERTAELVAMALRTGFRGIDTACQPKHYDEQRVGTGLRQMADEGVGRSDLYLQTKFTPLDGQDPGNVPYEISAPLASQVLQSVERSLQNLQTDYLDCLLLHSPLTTHALTMEAWSTLEQLQQRGVIGQLGISNCYDLDVMKALHRDATIKPAILQNRFYKNSGYDLALRRWCDGHGVIYQSFWSLTANGHLLDSELFHSLARQTQKSEAQILFRYLSHCGIVPLTGTTSEQHMREDLALFDFELSATEQEQITQLLFQP